MQLKLYEITQQYDEIFSRLYDEETGEINPVVQKELDALDPIRDKKCVAVASFIKNLEAEYKAIDEAQKAMAARKASFKSKMESCKDYLFYNMQTQGISEISCPYFAIKLKKNPPSVDLLDETLIPEEYKKVEVSIMKAAILIDLKEGKEVPGARIKQDLSLQIK